VGLVSSDSEAGLVRSVMRSRGLVFIGSDGAAAK
jgi:hypothetical protein